MAPALTDALVLLMATCSAHAWPGMKSSDPSFKHPVLAAADLGPPIGPSCTVGAHNSWGSPCPNMKQPPPPVPTPPLQDHVWASSFIVDWNMYFVPDEADAPPYNPLPKTAFNVTRGTTYYHVVDEATGLRNMKETYETFCIPVFGDPNATMGSTNNYSCDFLNVGSTNTSYVVLHDDRPPGAPECCIIGRPFHPPPPDFHRAMPVKWNSDVGPVNVDWGAVWDIDAGIFNYGFVANSTAVPFAFYMEVVPWVAYWAWQPFSQWRPVVPPADVWSIPDACLTAEVCPGWNPTH
jgi:hypothetical protein